MSLRRKRITIPEKVNVKFLENTLQFEGPKGKLILNIPDLVQLDIIDNKIIVNPINKKLKKAKSLAGFICKEISNIFIGLLEKIQYRLELRGVGYRAQIKNNQLELYLGYSHSNIINIPDDLTVSVQSNNEIVIEGINKNKVGLLAAQIRYLRPPEPYKGKGIFYKGEKIILKPGKSGKK
uniref:ribosomal protein L6 n=1 Tax=Merotricha bacillata TaxID=658122 RepID=UPI002113DD5C|nr:ribosomal protein L6 [Merotricha bacillata]UTE94487.1 ribosomal protein L6 [Merotricha bacillata]